MADKVADHDVLLCEDGVLVFEEACNISEEDWDRIDRLIREKDATRRRSKFKLIECAPVVRNPPPPV